MNKRISLFGLIFIALITILWIIDYIIPVPISFIGYCIYQLINGCVIFMIFLVWGVIAVQIWNKIFYKRSEKQDLKEVR